MVRQHILMKQRRLAGRILQEILSHMAVDELRRKLWAYEAILRCPWRTKLQLQRSPRTCSLGFVRGPEYLMASEEESSSASAEYTPLLNSNAEPLESLNSRRLAAQSHRLG